MEADLFLFLFCIFCDGSASGMDALKIEEMEKMLKEAQLEKARLIESRVSCGCRYEVDTVTIFIPVHV